MKALFWDFGDVLVYYDHMRSCRAFSRYCGKTPEQIYDAVFGNKLEEQHYNCGEYNDLEWYTELENRLGLTGCDYDSFAEIWGNIFSPNPAIGAVLDAVRPDVRQYVLSNTNGLHFAWARKNIPALAAHFSSPDRAILSSEEKSRKPESRIFERAFARASVAPEDAFFVDDKLSNVEAFEKFGGKGFVYSASATPVEELYAALEQAGLLER
jgi:putative hydrolase of the HAD superfamily